jgi:hypothetical protein
LWDYNVWSGKKRFFPLCPTRTADFDCLWCKFFELCNFELLHHLNTHHVRLLVYQILEVGDEWNILKCTEEGYNFFYYTSNFLWNFLWLHFLMKLNPQWWIWRSRCTLNLEKIKIYKKMKSPNSMRNGRFHPPKCRGKLQKMGVLYIHSSKMLGPSS